MLSQEKTIKKKRLCCLYVKNEGKLTFTSGKTKFKKTIELR